LQILNHMINNKTIYQVDAFTDEPFKGNPAGVMIIDESIEPEWMQKIAMEMNLSETAFIIHKYNEFQIRYFTPFKEVPLCGHATLASAHIIYELGMKKADDIIHFKAKGGDLTISKSAGLITMNFPKYPITKIDIQNDFTKTIGFEPTEMYSSIYDWKIAVAQSETDIIKATPDFETMKTNGLGHLMITAKADLKNTDFVVRCFAPVSGINEDPVTGSAHCALAPLWFEKTGKTEFNSYQLSRRTGKLKIKLINDRVEIIGKAVTIFTADLRI